MELQAMEIWIAFITLVLAPIIYGMRENANENKRIDVLLNKTREELLTNLNEYLEFFISLDLSIFNNDD